MKIRRHAQVGLGLAILLSVCQTGIFAQENLYFEQLNWIEPWIENSSWGRLTFEFYGYEEIRYFNLNVNGDWVIVNRSFSSAYGFDVPQKFSTMFDLGVSAGTDVTNLDYVYSVDSEPITSMPTGTFTTADVYDLDYQLGGIFDVNFIVSSRPPGGPNSTAVVIHSGQLADIDKFVVQETNLQECVPASVAGSLQYLEATGKINFSQDIEQVKQWIGWMPPSPNYWGFGTIPNWFLLKRDYLEEKDMNVRFINGPLTKTVALELIEELEAGQDIEIDVKRHCMVLAGIRIKDDNSIELDVFDDGQADGKIDPLQITDYNDPCNTIGGSLLERFVIECPDGYPDPNWYGWPQEDKLFASDGDINDFFGFSVALSDDYAIAGAYGDDDNGTDAGAAYIFKREQAEWTRMVKLIASDGEGADEFGYSVSISGDYAIVGAPLDDDNGTDSGAAYIFKRSSAPNDVNWYEQAKLTASDAAGNDYFGISVSISDDYAIVGAYGDDHLMADDGSAYIFKWQDPNWTQTAKLTASDPNINDQFGNSVAIDSSIVIIGAWHADYLLNTNAGAAYLFTRALSPSETWNQFVKLGASDANAYNEFGTSVSISFDRAIVGSPNNDDGGTDAGAAYIYMFSEPTWENKVMASDRDDWDRFGKSVSISGSHAIIGSTGDDYYGTNSGSAYVYRYEEPNWIEQTKINAQYPMTNDEFGLGVSIDQCHAIIGAIFDNGRILDTGAAYAFRQWAADLNSDCFIDMYDVKEFAEQWLTGN